MRGFTVIELLVVVAIIGILSTVVLSFMYAAQLKGLCRDGNSEACAKIDKEDREPIKRN